jgi:hypothetical protein
LEEGGIIQLNQISLIPKKPSIKIQAQLTKELWLAVLPMYLSAVMGLRQLWVKDM